MGTVDTGINASGTGCGTVVGIVRDFKGKNEPGGHPDFEAYSGDGVSPGLVGTTRDLAAQKRVKITRRYHLTSACMLGEHNFSFKRDAGGADGYTDAHDLRAC
jgi:hypothetical protein